MRAQQLMTAHPFAVAPTDSIAHAAELMRDLNVGSLPVVQSPENPILVGIITDRDITVRCVAKGHHPTCAIREHMSSMPLYTVESDADVDEITHKMERAQVRRIPVVGDGNILMGMIAQADLATKLGPSEPLQVEEMLERVSARRLVHS